MTIKMPKKPPLRQEKQDNRPFYEVGKMQNSGPKLTFGHSALSTDFSDMSVRKLPKHLRKDI
jgi:hypothetical protein